MSWYTPILWFLVGIFIGILVFLAGPIILGPHLPRPMAERIGDYYDSLAMRTAERLLLVRRRIGAYSPEPSTFDGEKGGERVKMDGEKHHFFDDIGLMGTFHRKPFGLVYEGLGTIIDPFLVSMYDYELEREASGEWLTKREEIEEYRPYGDDNDTIYDPYCEIPTEPALAEPRGSQDIVPGELGSKDPTTAETLFEKSQRLFGKPKTTDVMILIIAWGVGLGGYLALVYITGGGAISAPDMPGFPAVIWPW